MYIYIYIIYVYIYVCPCVFLAGSPFSSHTHLHTLTHTSKKIQVSQQTNKERKYVNEAILNQSRQVTDSRRVRTVKTKIITKPENRLTPGSAYHKRVCENVHIKNYNTLSWLAKERTLIYKSLPTPSVSIRDKGRLVLNLTHSPPHP